jgi:tetratricopeptide (TPR) repeat protein
MAANSSVLLAEGNSLEQVLQRAIACHAAGQLQEAGDLYRAVLHTDPKQPDANHNLGLLHIQARAPQDSLPYLLAALEAEPAAAHYWLSYIEALSLSGRHDDAAQVLDHARRQGLDGPNADALAARLQTARK